MLGSLLLGLLDSAASQRFASLWTDAPPKPSEGSSSTMLYGAVAVVVLAAGAGVLLVKKKMCAHVL